MYRLLTSILLSFLIATTSSASNKLSAEDETHLAFYRSLPTCFDEKRFATILSSRSPQELPNFTNWPEETQIEALYMYCFIKGRVYWRLLDDEIDTTERFQTYCTNGEAHLLTFLSLAMPIHRAACAQQEAKRDLIFQTQMYQSQVYLQLGLIYRTRFDGHLVRATDAEGMKPGLTDLHHGVMSCIKAYSYYRSTARGQPGYEAMLDTIREAAFTIVQKALLFHQSLDLMKKTGLANNSFDKKKPVWDAIKQARRLIDKEIGEPLTSRLRQEIEKRSVQTTQTRLAPARLGKQTKQRLAEKTLKQTSDALLEIKTTLDEHSDPSSYPTIELQDKYIRTSYMALLGASQDKSIQTITKVARDWEKLESIIDTYLNGNCELKTVYERLCRQLTDLELSLSPLILCSFINLGELDKTLLRLEIVKSIQASRNLPLEFANTLIALVRLFKGEPDMWIALEAERNARVISNKTKKKTSKQRQRERNAEAILEDQQSRREAERKAQEAVETQELIKVSAVQSRTAVEQPSKDKEEVAFVPSGDFKTIAQQEAEQLARHQAREEGRAQQGVVAVQKPAMVEVVVESAKPEPEISLVAAYKLTPAPRAVDESIETGVWRFTREQLKRYLKAMGCEYRPGKGVHMVLSLPDKIGVDKTNQNLTVNTTQVCKDGQVLTVFIDEGGSLTLPKWEGDMVPDYLKPQIQDIRRKLKALVIKAKKALEETE